MNKATTGTMIGLAMLANAALAGGEQAQERHPLRAFEELSPKILEIHERANEIDSVVAPTEHRSFQLV
ncbi:MAG: hypothetical protein R3D66_03675 [Alphaproteobacteria bacterium]